MLIIARIAKIENSHNLSVVIRRVNVENVDNVDKKWT